MSLDYKITSSSDFDLVLDFFFNQRRKRMLIGLCGEEKFLKDLRQKYARDYIENASHSKE